MDSNGKPVYPVKAIADTVKTIPHLIKGTFGSRKTGWKGIGRKRQNEGTRGVKNF